MVMLVFHVTCVSGLGMNSEDRPFAPLHLSVQDIFANTSGITQLLVKNRIP
jgi:hypothetical protein